MIEVPRYGYQCIHCKALRSNRVGYWHCPSCNERVLFEAIDIPYYTCNSIDGAALVRLAHNIAQAGFMEWSRRWGRMESCA